jgi:DNA-binding NarL/FixJ family response regulator
MNYGIGRDARGGNRCGDGVEPGAHPRPRLEEFHGGGCDYVAPAVPTRIVLVDDHPPLCLALRLLLEDTGAAEIVGEAHTGKEAVATVTATNPDLVVLDLLLPDMSGLDVAQAIRDRGTGSRIFVLTGYSDPACLRALLRLGVRGYVLKGGACDAIADSILQVARGATVLDPATAALAMCDSGPHLTRREEEVLSLVVAGARNSEIAAQLGVTVQTVEFHMGHVLRKLGARSRSDAISRAIRLGIVSVR